MVRAYNPETREGRGCVVGGVMTEAWGVGGVLWCVVGGGVGFCWRLVAVWRVGVVCAGCVVVFCGRFPVCFWLTVW